MGITEEKNKLKPTSPKEQISSVDFPFIFLLFFFLILQEEQGSPGQSCNLGLPQIEAPSRSLCAVAVMDADTVPT